MDDQTTMMPMGLDDIARAVGGRLVVPRGVRADGVRATSAVSDSRQVRQGSVFVAIAGERVDGHAFVSGAAESGAAAALVDHEVEAPVAQIVVDDTVAALGALAAHNIALRRASDTPFGIVGVTGSVGKTTTKDMLAALLGRMGATVAPVGSFNNEIGLPLTALRVGPDTRFLVAEMGANHVGEIAGLTRIAPPDIAVVLKVGVAHLGEFGSVERIVEAKSEIVRGLVDGGVSVLNADDANVASMTRYAPGRVAWFGIDDDRAVSGGMSARDIAVDALGRPEFTLVGPDGDSRRLTLGIRGAHNVMNALAAACVASLLGMDLERIAATLGSLTHISPHRMAVSRVRRDGATFALIDDSFNANPDSTRAGLDGLHDWRGAAGGHPFRVAVLGGMLELGDREVELHREVGAYAIHSGVDALVAVGSPDDAHVDALAQAIARGAREASDGSRPSAAPSIHWVHDIDQADAEVTRMAGGHADTVVLLKGSHASGLSALADRWTADAVHDHRAADASRTRNGVQQ